MTPMTFDDLKYHVRTYMKAVSAQRCGLVTSSYVETRRLAAQEALALYQWTELQKSEAPEMHIEHENDYIILCKDMICVYDNSRLKRHQLVCKLNKLDQHRPDLLMWLILHGYVKATK